MRKFCTMIQTQFQTRVKVIRSDKCNEFTSNPMKKFYREQGIIHETGCVDTPQQNGRVERKHHQVLNVAKALHFESSLPLEFWVECVLAVDHLINRTPTHILCRKTLYETLFGVQPSLDHIKVFGCLCYAYNIRRKKEKFGARIRRYMIWKLGKYLLVGM